MAFGFLTGAAQALPGALNRLQRSRQIDLQGRNLDLSERRMGLLGEQFEQQKEKQASDLAHQKFSEGLAEMTVGLKTISSFPKHQQAEATKNFMGNMDARYPGLNSIMDTDFSKLDFEQTEGFNAGMQKVGKFMEKPTRQNVFNAGIEIEGMMNNGSLSKRAGDFMLKRIGAERNLFVKPPTTIKTQIGEEDVTAVHTPGPGGGTFDVLKVGGEEARGPSSAETQINIDLGKPPSPAERTAIAETRASIDSLDNLETLFQENFTGPVAGRVGATKNIFGLNPVKQEEFIAATFAFKNQVIKEITGAQMSEQEAARIMKQVPEVTDAPSVWQAKLKQSRENLRRLNKRRAEVLEQSGLRVPETTKPTWEQFLPQAQAANPGTSEKELREFYDNKYGGK